MKYIYTPIFIALLTGCAQPKPTSADAWLIAQKIVKLKINQPIEFTEQGRKYAEFGDSSYVFNGLITSPGAAGTMHYNIGIKWNGGDASSDQSWILKFANIK